MSSKNVYERENVYASKNPYASKDEAQGGNDNQEKQFKKQDEDTLKASVSSIFDDLINSKENQISDFKISTKNSSIVLNYYNKYYSDKVVANGILLMILSFISSFFTVYSIFILSFFVVLLSLNTQKSFFKKYTNHIKIDTKFHKEIYKKLFFSTLEMKKVYIIFLALSSLILVSYFLKFSLFLNEDIYKNELFFLLHTHLNFDVNNTLFSILNTTSILILILLKNHEKKREINV